MHLLRPIAAGAADYPWTGVIIGGTITSMWYWCSDQVIVQRTLAAKSYTHAKGGTIVAAYLKVFPLFILVFPGMVSRILFTDDVGCADPDLCEEICDSRSGCTNIAYTELVLELLPKGVKGLMFAVMLSALLTSLTSVFNSSATIFTVDIWPRFRRHASEVEHIIVGRIAVLVLIVISVAWVPVITNLPTSQLFVYIQQISNYLGPPIASIYVLAMFWERTNEPGAFWGLMFGLLLGMMRFICEFSVPMPACNEKTQKDIDDRNPFIVGFVDKINYLHFGAILFLLVGIVAIVVSLLTKPIPKKHLHRLTFWSRHSKEVRVDLDELEKELEKQQQSDSHSHKSDTSEEGELSCGRKTLNLLCGVKTEKVTEEEDEEGKLTKEEEAEAAVEFLKETPRWKAIVDSNAVLVMAVAMVLWTFWA